MEVFNEFGLKMKNAYRSGTMWLGAVVLMMGGSLKFLEWIQSDWLPMIAPLINPTFAAWLSVILTSAIWYFRFKTIQSLASK
jgi:hypothetical protein